MKDLLETKQILPIVSMTNFVTLLSFISHKNIIHITGNDSYGVELELERWLGAFRGKFGDINIDRYDLGDKDQVK